MEEVGDTFSIKERIERGEDPAAARRAALDELGYVGQSAPGVGTENMTFSVAEIDDLKAGATTIAAFGDFSTIEFTLLNSGEPRLIHAGVVGGSYFDVMGLRPVLARRRRRRRVADARSASRARGCPAGPAVGVTRRGLLPAHFKRVAV